MTGSGSSFANDTKKECVMEIEHEGCEEDISGSKAYYRNHKICVVHFKAPVIRVGGARERFCQQCTRFHALSEFDGSKRACRKSLEAHNKRRRKFILPELDDADTELVLGFQDSEDNLRMNVDQSGKRKADQSLRPTFKHFKLRCGDKVYRGYGRNISRFAIPGWVSQGQIPKQKTP
ncbi:Squamosa promoter-binding-like protein 13A [Acorus calamus]|uniref:Squamosa promoter-binding-like protein 13A n=1 Tax=Acorus calamus TaxID=4465 RepID=A0AAV9EB33_ACOCL|nr:Squamosa promoter-binding-like protein 13A [Acorus calamus]